MAGLRLSWLARNGRSPGEESLNAAIAAQAIEAQPSFGQIKPSEAALLAVRQPSKEKTWRISPAQEAGPLGAEKEIPACRWAAAGYLEPDEYDSAQHGHGSVVR